MKNIICKAFVVVMIFALLPISVEAVFDDQESIQHKEEVNKMSSLNIINGKDNDNFDPDGYATRAEKCRIVNLRIR